MWLNVWDVERDTWSGMNPVTGLQTFYKQQRVCPMPACLFKPLDFTTHSEAAQLSQLQFTAK